MIQAIDPGTLQSAVLLWDGKRIIEATIMENRFLLESLRSKSNAAVLPDVVIEMVASYGMPVGREVFETVLWIGRFMESIAPYGRAARLVYRRDVKLHHCMDSRAKDANIRQALVDRFGDKGTKKAPGLTYGLKKDLWSAFAIATYAFDKFCTQQQPALV